ncbi:hypothetical protein EUGRSUZ_J02385 [Eucalyptus grandis]|uniref:Uncharacterized protein n=2 Tax=Eucalyptus grandis TaxID=71139 RepID=A0ACC3J8I3_EUCGR|nr:hypothetical protein EUGRSUZ_J02385 [Eucalyptus grandis]
MNSRQEFLNAYLRTSYVSWQGNITAPTKNLGNIDVYILVLNHLSHLLIRICRHPLNFTPPTLRKDKTFVQIFSVPAPSEAKILQDRDHLSLNG